MNPSDFRNAVPPQMQQNNIAIRQQIISNLRSQHCPPGWQQTFRIENRAVFVHQITTQLFLVKPDMTEQKALDVAFEFERREFFGSPDEETYRAHCKGKLSDIAEARQNQANMQNQRRLQNQTSQGFGSQQQMFQQGLINPTQFQQGLGGPSMQQMNQVNNMGRLQQAQIHQQQMANAARLQQGLSSAQPAVNMLQQPQQNQGPHALTPEEQEHIQQRAQQMAVNLTDAERENIARKVRSLPEQTKIQLRQQGLNPIQTYLHHQATTEYRQEKARGMMMQQNQGLPTHNSAATQLQATPQPGMPPQTLNSQHFNQMGRSGNVNQQIFAQQQEGLRRQQAGQVVVPGNPGHGGSGTQQQSHPQRHQQPQQQPQQQPGRSNPAWHMQHQGAFQQQQQSLWNDAQGQQMSHTQGQAPTPQMAVAGQQPGTQGQMDGMNGSSGMRTAQHTPAMPTLNQPMATPGQTQNTLSPRPGHSNTQLPQGNAQPGMNGQLKASTAQSANLERFRNLPPVIQQQLARLPSDAARGQFLLDMRAKQQEMRRKQNVQSTGGTPRGGQNGIQSQQSGLPGAVVNRQNDQNNQDLSGRPAQGASVSVQPPRPTMQVARKSRGPGQPPGHSTTATHLIINEEQTRFMDGLEFPRGILNNKSAFGRVPENAKTWGELKQFVSQNARSLPDGLLRKLGELQAQAYHLNVVPQMNQQRQRMVQQQGTAAPTAQMVSGNQGQPHSMGFGATGPHQMPPLPQPTVQEVQAVRNNLQANAQGMSDDQIRSAIMSKRHQTRQNNAAPNQQGLAQQHQQHQHQQIQYNNMPRAQQIQHSKNNNPLLQNPQGQQQQQSFPQNRQPVPKAPQANMSQSAPAPIGQARQAVANRGTASNQKNLKRNNNNINDDVVEIADPKISKQAAATKGVQPTQAPLQFTQQQFETMSDQQKAQYMPQRQRQSQAVQNGQTQAMQAKPNLDPAKQKQELEQASLKVRAILAEVQRNLGRRPLQPMSPKTRGSMIQKLRDSQPMAQRVEMVLTYLLKMTGNEEKVREMARMHLLLREQVRDKSFTPIENFTVSAEELDQILLKLKEQCASVLSKMVPPQQKGASRQQLPQTANQQSQRALGSILNQQQASASPQPQKLTAESLQQQQEAIQRSRAASLQKNQNSSSSGNNHSINRPPAAPTTTHAPFPFGQHSPQGVPVIYNTRNELTQDKLVLPAAKKRKNNNQASAASTPAQTSQTPGSQSSPFNKVDSPEAQRAPAVPVAKLRCTVPGCKTKALFNGQADLDKHVANAHPSREEDVTDPLAYCLEGFRIILNLDERGKAKHAESTSTSNAQPSVLKKSASSQGPNIKQEVATPTSRNPTGTGRSPSAHILKTPQPSNNVKTPASDTKSTGQAAAMKTIASKVTDTAAADSWANAKVPMHWFPTVFGDVADLNRPVSSDFLTDWLERNPFNLSSDDCSSSSKHSPHASDISANDELNVNLVGDSSNIDWIPSDWLDDGLVGDLATSVLDPLLEMDWDTAFGGGGGAEQKELVVGRARKRNEGDASDEFLRVYAPDKLEERTKKEPERRR
ncbi:MAG: hypothetical protein Q9217_005018 [Psora testacea]